MCSFEEKLCIYSGIMPALLIYPVKYLNAPLLPYKSFLDHTILLISALLIVIDLLYLRNAFLLLFSLPKIKTFCFIFILCKDKKLKKKIILIFWHHYNFCGTLSGFFLSLGMLSIS